MVEPVGPPLISFAVRATMDTAVGFSSLVVVFSVVALCVAFSLVVVRACLIAPVKPGVLQQLLILGAAILLFSGVGGMLIAPTGPGSGWPVFVMSAVPCVFFLVVGSRLPRIAAAVVACACLVGIVSEFRARAAAVARFRAAAEHRARMAEDEPGSGDVKPEPSDAADSR